MEATNYRNSTTDDFFNKVINSIGQEGLEGAFVNLLGPCELMAKYVMSSPSCLPPVDVCYAVIQYASIRSLLFKILHNKFDSCEKKIINYMPVNDEAWKSEEDFEKRFIFVVTQFYEHLKKEGKIK